MKFEMQSSYANIRWELVALPKGRKAIPNKWVYKVKCVDDKPKYKACLVAKGYAQKEGIDFKKFFHLCGEDDYAPCFVYFMCSLGFGIGSNGCNLITAFLHGDPDEELYMQQPPEGFVIPGKEHLV